jgi:hypothetical protein
LKLTQEQVDRAADEISRGRGSIRTLAEEYGVNESTLRRRLPTRVRSQARRAADTAAVPAEPAIVEIPVIHRDYSNYEKIKVYPMGDFHIGSPYHHAAKLDEWLGYMEATPNATLLNTGDNFNAAILNSKSDIYAEQGSVTSHMKDFESRFGGLADDDRLDVLTGGNHEARIYRATGLDVMNLIAHHLDVSHYEGAAAIVYHVGDQEYMFWVRHGTGNAPKSMNAITAGGYSVQADVYVTGHTHRQSVVLDDFFVPSRNGGKVTELGREPRRYVTSGSFVLYERYAAERGYAPSHLGAPRIHLSGRRKDVHVSI